MNRLAPLLAAALLCALPACGGGAKRAPTGPKKVETPKLPPVKPAALREFDAGLRALRLGGPRAYERAQPRLEKAVEIDGTLWEAWHNLGTIHFAEGRDDQAITAYSSAVKVNPASSASILGRAEARRRAGKFDEALADYREIVTRKPDNAQVRVRTASMLRGQGKLDAALGECREALKYSNDAAIYVELGQIYLAQGRDELAELVLVRAVELDEKQPVAWNALALVSMERGKDQEAFARFDKATALDPGYRDARYNKASVLLDAGDFEAALEELRAVVKAAPDDHGARVAMGIALRGLQRFDRARKMWEQVVAEAPGYAGARGDALWNLATLELDFIKDEGKGKAALERYLQNSPRRHPKRDKASERLTEIEEMGG